METSGLGSMAPQPMLYLLWASRSTGRGSGDVGGEVGNGWLSDKGSLTTLCSILPIPLSIVLCSSNPHFDHEIDLSA